PLALETVNQHLGRGELAVGRPARQPAVAAFANDQPPLAVESGAIAFAGVFAQQFGLAARPDPVEFAGPHIDEIIEAVGVPERPFGEHKAGPQALGLGLIDDLRQPVHGISSLWLDVLIAFYPP